MNSHRPFLGFLFVLAALAASLTAAEEVSIRGTIFCVDESRNEVPCAADSERFALLDSSGRRHYFMSEDPKSRMFTDPRIRERDLEVRVWQREEDQIEIIKVYSIKEGKKYDIHYFCSICNITAYVEGPCWCCQQEFELRETPLP